MSMSVFQSKSQMTKRKLQKSTELIKKELSKQTPLTVIEQDF